MVWTPYHSVNRIFESAAVLLILIKQIGWCWDYYAIFIQVLLSRHAHGRKVLIECRNKILILHQFFILITSMWAGIFTTNRKIHFKWCADLFLIEICFKKLTLKEQKRQYNRISIAAVSYGGDFIWHVTRCLSIFHWYFRNKQINPNKLLGIFFSFHPWLRVLEQYLLKGAMFTLFPAANFHVEIVYKVVKREQKIAFNGMWMKWRETEITYAIITVAQ